MKKNILLYFSLITLLFCGCGEEDGELTPSWKDKDWFALKDSPDKLDHLRYEIYKDKGISIYYNDTIGSEFRGISGYGDSIIHHEILDLCYEIDRYDITVEYTLSENRENIYAGVLLVKDQIIPLLPPVVYPRSMLFVSELILNANTTEANGLREGRVWRGLMSTTMSYVDDVPDMAAAEQKDFATEVAGELIGHYLSDHPTEKVMAFYDLSEKEAEWAGTQSDYSIYKCKMESDYNEPASSHPAFAHWYALGFLNPSPDLKVKYYKGELDVYQTPTCAQDLSVYMKEVLLGDDLAFMKRYEEEDGYEVIRSKYLLAKELVADLHKLVKP